jgi:hypothetical protein
MAVTLKRKRAAVSYRESSSDEDISNSLPEPLSPSRRAIPVRRSARHQSTEAQPLPSRPRRAISRASPVESKAVERRHALRRGGKPQVSYRDLSSEDDDDAEDFVKEEVMEKQGSQRRNDSSLRPQRSRKPRARLGRPSGTSQRKPLDAPLKITTGRCCGRFAQDHLISMQYNSQL